VTSQQDSFQTKSIEVNRSEIGLMEFIRFDAGAVLAKAGVNGNPKSIRLITGNR
jgi:hypothetical protein